MGKLRGGGWFSPVRANKAALANAQGTVKAAGATLDRALAAERASVALVERCKLADRELVKAKKDVAAARGTLRLAQNILTDAAGHKATANTRKLANAAAAAKKANTNRAARKALYEAEVENSAQKRVFLRGPPMSLNDENMPSLESMQDGGNRKTRKRKTCK